MGFSQTEGTGSNGVLVVGEALGGEEARDGLPFRPKAAAGSKLEEAFKLPPSNRRYNISLYYFK